jgi:lactoylglutathione lyase
VNATSLIVLANALAACARSAHAPAQELRPMLQLRCTGFFVEDVPATVQFYEAAFGLRLRYLHPSRGYAELDTGATLLAFVGERFEADVALLGGRALRINRRELDPIAAQIALVTSDLDAAWQRAVDAGAEIVKRPEPKPWGQTVGYLRDHNGVLVELATRSPRDP